MTKSNLVSRFKQQPRWLRISAYIITAYLVYALLLGAVVPLALQSQLPKSLSNTLGRTVTVDSIHINPFLLRLTVSQFRIAGTDEQETFFRFGQLEADVGFWRSLTSLTPTLEHVYLDQPYAYLARLDAKQGNTFNFSDIVSKLEKNATKTPSSQKNTETLPHFRLDRFALNNGHLQIADNGTGTELAYPNLTFELSNLDTLANLELTLKPTQTRQQQNRYQVNIATDNGGKLHFDGVLQLSPLGLSGKVELTKISLSPLWPLSREMIEANLSEGQLDLALRYRLYNAESGLHFAAQNGSATFTNVALSDKDKPRIKMREIALTGIAVNSETKRVSVDNVVIDQPWLDGVYDKNGFDLVSILTPKAQTSDYKNETPPPSASEAPWLLSLGSFKLNDGDVRVKENTFTQGMFWRVHPINVQTGELQTDFTSPIELNLDLAFAGDPNSFPDNGKGKLTVNSEIDLAAMSTSGHASLSAFSLPQLQAYISPFLTISMTEGLVSSSGDFNLNSEGKIHFEGQAGVDTLTVLDGVHYEPLLKWDSMAVSDIRYSSDDDELSVGTITLNKPFGKLLIDKNKQTNLDNIVRSEEQSAPQKANPVDSRASEENTSVPPLLVKIDNITISDGSAYFSDQSLTPQFASSIESLNGKVSNLHSQAGSAAKVNLKGKIDSYAPVTLQGEINPLLEQMFLDLNFVVEGAELTSVNPYAGTYMGYYIDKGQLSLDVTYQLQSGQLKGDNHVVINQLTLGKETDSEQALSLPLGLAVALLQDSDGVIDLGLEVSGDVDNPQFSFGSIILNALGNLVKKAVTAPFSFLASLVGSDDTLNEVDFAAGVASLDKKAKERLTSLAEALNERPGLRVNIEGTVNEVTDARELAVGQLHHQLLSRVEQTTLPDNFSASNVPLEGPLAEALETLFTDTLNKSVEQERETVLLQHTADKNAPVAEEEITRSLHIAMYNQLRNAIDISQGDLASLASERARTVKQFLANEAGVEAKRLFLLNSAQHLQSDTSSAKLTLETE